MSELTQLEMTLEEARETDRLIKRHINTTRYLLLDMRDRKGWKAIGYESFVEYGEKELSLGAARIYQLADAAEISLQIGFSTLVENQPKETHLRPLKSVPEDERKAIWEEATRKAQEEGAKLTAKRVEASVEEWKQRNDEWAAQSGCDRMKIRDLEAKLAELKSQQVLIGEVIPSAKANHQSRESEEDRKAREAARLAKEDFDRTQAGKHQYLDQLINATCVAVNQTQLELLTKHLDWEIFSSRYHHKLTDAIRVLAALSNNLPDLIKILESLKVRVDTKHLTTQTPETRNPALGRV